MRTIAKPIQMVNWTDENGTITPVRFKIKNEEGAATVVKILGIHKRDKERIAGNITYTFHCEILINQQTLLCEIRYDLASCKWILFKL